MPIEKHSLLRRLRDSMGLAEGFKGSTKRDVDGLEFLKDGVTIADRRQKRAVSVGREREISSRRDGGGGEKTFEKGTVEIEELVEDLRVEGDAELEETVEDSRVEMESSYNNRTEEIRERVTDMIDDLTATNREEVEHRRAKEREELSIIVGDRTVQRDLEAEDPTAGGGSGRERRERLVSSRLTGYLWSINREEASDKKEEERKKGE